MLQACIVEDLGLIVGLDWQIVEGLYLVAALFCILKRSYNLMVPHASMSVGWSHCIAWLICGCCSMKIMCFHMINMFGMINSVHA